MAKAWADVVSSEQFQSLPADAKETARQQYFEQVIAPQVPANDVGFAKDQFLKSTSLTPTVKKPAPKAAPSDEYDFGSPMGTGAEEIMAVAVAQPKPKFKSVLNTEYTPEYDREDLIRSSNRKYVEQGVEEGNRLAEVGKQKLAIQKAGRDRLRKEAEAEDYGFLNFAQDSGLDLSKGAVGLGEMYVGLLNLTSGGAAGRVLGKMGFNPDRTTEFLNGLQSITRKNARQNVKEAEGFLGTLEALAVNPTELIGSVVESLPGTVTSGAAGGKFVRMIAGKAALEAKSLGLVGQQAQDFIRDKVKDQAYRIALVTGSTEGAQTAGSIAEKARQKDKDWSDYVMPALAAGLGTAAISSVSGKVAQKFGIGDIETNIAARSAGIKDIATGEGAYLTKLFKEVFKEGVLEELPQGIQEQIFTNVATGRPWDENVDKAAAQSLVAGIAMAGGHSTGVALLQKTSELAKKTLGPREGAYRQDTSYEGEAERIARSKGFLTPESAPGKTTTTDMNLGAVGQERPGADTSTTPPPPEKTQKEKTIDALTARIASRGVDEAEARAAATLAVEEEERKRLARDEEAAKELPTYYPKEPNSRVEQIFQDAVDNGMDPVEAREFAIKQAAQEKKDDDLATRQLRKKAKGKTNVEQPISGAVGTSTSVAGQPDTELPAGGTTGVDTGGVDATGQNVTGTVGGETAQPPALSTAKQDTPFVMRSANEQEQSITSGAVVTLPLPGGAKAIFTQNGDGDIELIAPNGKADKVVRAHDPREGSVQSLANFPDYVPEPLRQLMLDYQQAAREQYYAEGDSKVAAQQRLTEIQNKITDTVVSLETKAAPTETKPQPYTLTRGAVTPEAVGALSDEQLDTELTNTSLSDAEYGFVKEEITQRQEGNKSGPETSETVETTQEGQAPPTTGAVAGKTRGRPPVQQTHVVADNSSGGFDHVANGEVVETYKTKKQATAAVNLAKAKDKGDAVKIAKFQAELDASLASKGKGRPAKTVSEEGAEELSREEKVELNALESALETYNSPASKDSIANAAMYISEVANDKTAPEAVRNRAKQMLEEEIDPKDIPKKLRSADAKVGKADTGFSKLTTGSQAIAHIIKTGNLFQRFVAQRIRNFVTNVKFVVVERGDGTPANILKELEGARGLFEYTPGSKQRTVYVRGSSFGNQQGINIITVLHELLHAATASRIEAGLFKGFRNSSLQKFMREMESLMKSVESEYRLGVNRGTVSSDLQDLVEADAENVEFDSRGRPKFQIFNDANEFLAYGMSSPEFQKFLMSVRGKRGTGFSGFVNNIRDLFGINQGEATAFSDLIDITDKMLGTRLTPIKQGKITLQQRTTKPGTLSKTAHPDTRAQREIDADVNKALTGVAISKNAEKLADEVSLLNAATDPRKFLEILNIAYDVGERNTKAVMVNFATTDFLAQDWGGSQVPELKNLNKLIQEMHGMSARLIEGAADPSNVIANAMKAEPSLITKLSVAAYTTTNAEIDPTSDKRSALLNKMFTDLGPRGRTVYTTARDYFTDVAALYGKILDDQINNLSITSQDKANLLTKIKAIYEPRRAISPYFALVRRGPYWLKVGGGQGRQFFMFQSQIQRDYVALRLAISRKNQTASRAEGSALLEEAYQDKSMQAGNNVGALRKASYQSSKMLTGLFDAIDGMQLSGLTPEQAEVQRETLKDTAYELYLMTLPEQSFRNKFLSREGIPGYSTDFLQNFSDTAVTMATQLARIKYAPKIRASLSAAQDSIEGKPDLEPFVDEMSDRVDLELPGAKTSSLLRSGLSSALQTGANFLSRAAYIHYLSSASSALLQPLSIVQFGLPLLGARHGYTATAAEMVKLFKVWNSYGVSTPNSDGTVSYHMPSLRGSKGMTPLENRALTAMIGRNVAQATLASEMLARKNKPTTQSLSRVRNALGKGWWGLSGGLLMHSAERIAQEIVYLTSFRLSYRNALKAFKKSVRYTSAPNVMARRKLIEDFEDAKFQDWVDQAVVDTHESLGNMAGENRPPLMRNPGGQLLLQFNMFPLHAVIHLGKNFFRMIKPMKQEKRWEATKIFFGTMGATTILFGAVALPMVMTIIGFLNGMWRSNRENLPKELQDLDWYDWFRTQWLPQYLSGFETSGYIGGKKVRESLVDIIDRGFLNKFTGADFSSRGSLANLFIREGKEARTTREAAENVIIEKAGASVNQFLAYMDAYQAYKMGDYRTAAEKAAPAFLNKGLLTYKYATEGAKDYRGAQIISKDAISTGELIWQAIGFRSDLLANAQNVNFKMTGIERKIENERSEILKKITLHDESKNLKEYTKAWAEKDKFNKHYPWTQIEDETIDKALESAREKRAMSWKGTQVTEKNAPYTVPAITRSRMDIEAREKEAAQRKKVELNNMANK
jgi:hypothetical protein